MIGTDGRAARGSAALELVVGTGLLILPVVLLVLSLPTWAQTHTAARMAAREAARTVVLAEDPTGADARSAANRAAATVAGNHGRQLGTEPRLEWSEHRIAGTEVTQLHVVATVTLEMPAIAIPFLGEWASIDWSVTHAEPVDVYRSR